MAVINEKKRAKAHKLLKNHDLELNPMDYNASMMRATNYLNVTYDAKARMSWIKARFPKAKFGEHSDLDFRTLSTLIRLQDNGNALSDAHIALIDVEYNRLLAKSTDKVKIVEVVVSAPKASIQEKMDTKVSEFLAEFAALVDGYATDRTIPNVARLINSMGIRGPMVNKVAARVQNTMAELREAIEGQDKQLVEGYSQFKKAELKKLLGIYESLIAALGQAKVTTVRKTRAVKVKPPAVIAKWVKFCAEDTELKLKSINPAQAVGASEIWTYNNKVRKITCYKATEGATLTFKGTSLLNFDVEKSVIKTVRKPEGLTKLVGQGTRAWNAFLKTITTKPGIVKGRFGEDTLILSVMK